MDGQTTSRSFCSELVVSLDFASMVLSAVTSANGRWCVVSAEMVHLTQQCYTTTTYYRHG